MTLHTAICDDEPETGDKYWVHTLKKPCLMRWKPLDYQNRFQNL